MLRRPKYLSLAALWALVLAPVAVHAAGTTPVLTITVTPPSSAYGQPVQVKVTVSGTAGIATGYVKLEVDNTSYGGLVALDATGSATIGVPDSTVGVPAPVNLNLTPAAPHMIGAEYTGDSNYLPALQQVAFTVTKQPTTTVVSGTSNAAYGQPVTLTATVTPQYVPLTGGTVDFFDGATKLNSSPVALSGSTATFTPASQLAPGGHSISAAYGGDANSAGSTGTFSLTIIQVSSTLSLGASLSTAAYGQPVVLTAKVGPAPPQGVSAPTGSVTFQEGGTTLATVPVSSASAMLVNIYNAGTHTVTASYSGDTVWSPASASASFTVTKTATRTLISLAAQQGQYVLSAPVYPAPPGGGIATGQVQFLDSSTNAEFGTVNLVNGVASLSLTQNPALRPVVAVYKGDSNFNPSTSLPLLRLISAAANVSTGFAPDGAVSAFNVSSLTGDTPAASLPLPTTLSNTTVKVTDNNGTSRFAPLYGVFSSTQQINLVMPSDTAPGQATVTVTAPDNTTLSTLAQITRIAPTIFSANQNGQGVFAGQFIHEHADLSQTQEFSATYDPATKAFVPVPLDFGPATDNVFLVLYGTGIRHRTSMDSVTVTVGGTAAAVKYADDQHVYPGLDQVNVELPRSLAGAGTVNIVVKVEDQTANTVTVAIK